MMAESDDAQNSRESFILEVSGDGENELSIGSREILPPKFSKSPPTAHQGESGNQTLQRTKKCSLQAKLPSGSHGSEDHPGTPSRRQPRHAIFAVILSSIAAGLCLSVVLLRSKITHLGPGDRRWQALTHGNSAQGLATRVLVRLKNGSNVHDALAEIEGAEGVYISRRGNIAVVEMNATEDGGVIEQRLARLQEISGIESAEQDQWLYLEEELEQDQLGQNSRVLSAEDFNALDGESLYSSISNLAPNDIGFSFQWNLLSLGLDAGLMHDGFPGAWAHTTGSHEIKVCVIDSGVDYTHPDLVANMWTNLGEIPSNGIDDDGNGYIDDVHGYNFADDNGDPMDAYTNGHGTHVAGIIGAVGNNRMGVSGVAQDLSIIACKFLLDSGRGLISDAIRCMDYCEAVGAHIITSSAGDPSRSYTFRAAIEEATTEVLFVCSAGNDATDADVVGHYPSGFGMDNLLAVAASGRSGALSGYTNWGSETIDMASPGDEIWSTFPENNYKKMSGSSMAAPQASGAAALLLSVDPSLSASEVKRLLLLSAVRSAFLEGKVSSGGRLHIGKAVSALLPIIQEFEPGQPFDLAFSAIHFEPALEKGGAFPCSASGITGFPVSPQGGRPLPLTSDNIFLSVDLGMTFPFGGMEAAAVFVHATGALTIAGPLDWPRSPSHARAGKMLGIFPLWSNLTMDKGSEVTVKQTGESVAFTFSRMQLGDGRASFQVVLYDDGGILLAWLDVPRGPSATIVGLNNIGPQATNQMQSVDLSGITSCSQGQLVQRISGAPPRAPPPPPVQVFTSPRSLDLFDHTVCYNLEEKGAKISGCLMPQLEPFLPVHPAGGLTSNIWLRSSDDWVKIDLEKGRTFPSYRDGAPLDRVYVTGRGTVAFAEPYPGSPGNQTSPLDAHFSLPQVSLLANDNWEGKGGLMVDYKQLAEALVVTVYRGPPFPAELVVPIAQASLSWDGKACVSYPQDLRAVAASLSNKHSLLVGASDGKGIPGRLIWQADMTRLPACKTPQEDTLSSRMPAEIFSAGMMFDLENTMLRFTPLGSSYMGVCRVPGEVDSFPVDLSGDRRLEIPYGGVLKVDFEWEDTNGEQVSYPMLGRDYRSVLIGSDGYVAFDSQVADRIASAERMYRTRRIAPMFATIDLEDSNAKVSVQHYKDQLAITFKDVPLMGSGISRSSNSFQVSMHSSGQVDLTFLSMDRISMATRVVGISGGAMPSVWMPSDLSQAPVCVDSVVEVFGFGHPFDMEMSTLSLVPRATDQVVPPTMQYWEACGNNLEGNDLPVDPYSPGSETIFFTSGGSQVVYFKDGMHFPFFGTDYRHVHVGIDGYLTFDQEDLKPVKSLDDHFRLKRISVFSSPVNHSNPTRVVKVSYSRDRVAITYMDSGSSPNPAMFQVELRASGTIVLSWLHVPRLESPIVGISNGMARLATWQPTSFSSIMGSCD